jgi:hypothetical protein
MYALDNSYATMSAFVLGCDAGSCGGMLTGFREWLIVRLGTGNNLAWTGLNLHLAPGGFVHPLTSEADVAAVTTLFDLLDEFMEQRERHDGLLAIYGEYQSWLNTQTWYRKTGRSARCRRRQGGQDAGLAAARPWTSERLITLPRMPGTSSCSAAASSALSSRRCSRPSGLG